MQNRAFAPLLSIALFLAVLGCGKANPVAPNGSTITLTANPSVIASPTGTSTITAIIVKPNGTPATTGTQVRFSTDLGTIDPIESTDRNGVATATLHGDGRFGKATVTATISGSTTSSGTGSTPAVGPTVAVQIGNSAKTITLQANPPNLTAAGGSVRLLALVRDSNGQPLAGAGVNFTTTLGTLRSRGAIVTTDASGQASDTLTLSATDVANQTVVTVTANTAGGDGTLISSNSFAIQIQSGRPVADFVADPGGNGGFTVNFQDRSIGGTGALSYNWTFGDGGSSTDQNPSHAYPSTAQTYTVTLIVTDGTQSSSKSKTISVPVTTEQ